MACSTCDGYEFVPGENGDGNVDCPDCRAVDQRPLQWCPVHSHRIELDGLCRACAREAARATLAILTRTVQDVKGAQVENARLDSSGR
jgi:hypothetical protein